MSGTPLPADCERISASGAVRILGTTRDERLLHQRFAADRTHREWFRLSPGLGQYIDDLLAKVRR